MAQGSLTPLSPPHPWVSWTMTSWWLQRHHPYSGRKYSPAHLKPGQGETQDCVRQAPMQQCHRLGHSTCCRDCVPSSAQPLHLPWWRIKLSASTCYVDVVIAFLQLHGTRLSVQVCRTVEVERDISGSSGPKVLSALVQILFVLLHPLQTVQGMMRLSSLALLAKFLRKNGMWNLFISFWYIFSKHCHRHFEVTWHSIVLQPSFEKVRII